jgi:rhodanese-related sulfurtransferase
MVRPPKVPAYEPKRGPLRLLGAVLSGFLLLGLAVMVLPPAWMGMTDMPPDALRARLAHGDPRLVVVDVRTGVEFRGGHIPRAVPVPLHLVPFRLSELAPYRGREVVLVCLTGHRSRLAGLVLRLAGFGRVINLAGGMTAWRARGYREELGP